MFKKRFLKKYREKLKKIKCRCDSKIKNEKDKILNILLHDVKTPLLAQKQVLEHILNCFCEKKSEEEKLVSDVLSSNCFLLDIVSNIIFLINYENNKPKLKLENINITEEIKNCCNVVQKNTINKNQKIILEFDKNIEFFADKIFIKKIILNLLSSSIACGFENSNIKIKVKENDDSIIFFTKNKSVYMTKEKINSLLKIEKNFSDFGQLGMDLNFSVANRLILAHKWDPVIVSNSDNSTSFGFIIKK